MLARLALLCALCRDDFDAARGRMIASHRAAHGILGSSLTMELRKKLKADPRPKVTEMIKAAELLYNTELTRARECDPSTILESLFALEDGELKIAALRSDAYGGSTTILREEERRDQSRVLVREEAQSGAKIYRIAQSLSRIEGCFSVSLSRACTSVVPEPWARSLTFGSASASSSSLASFTWNTPSW